MVARIDVGTSTFALLVGASAMLYGCSDDSASPPTYTPFDSGTVLVPEAGPASAPSVTVQIQGKGTVYSSDAQQGDGGVYVGNVVCTPTSSASACTAQLGVTLYAVADTGWAVSTWTSTGLPASANLSGDSYAYTVNASTPSPLIVMFAQPSIVPVTTDSGAAPSDAGGD